MVFPGSMIQPKHDLFNYDKFVERLFGDEVLAQRIGWKVLRDLDKNIRGLKNAINDRDEIGVNFFLHGIKGVAANAHCEALFELSRELEHEAKGGNVTQYLAGMDQLIRVAGQSAESLRNCLNNLPRS